jgi:hypothetical protein
MSKMLRELLTAVPFRGTKDSGFVIEAAGGSAKLQFEKSDGTYVDKPDASYTTNDLIRLDMFEGQNYQWILSGAKVFRAPD